MVESKETHERALKEALDNLHTAQQNLKREQEKLTIKTVMIDDQVLQLFVVCLCVYACVCVCICMCVCVCMYVCMYLRVE